MSMGGADNFLLAMGPIGVITIVVNAIRIGGCILLKSLIGRSRTQAVAEQELLSSTSSEVCEVWNGQHVSRLIGEPRGILTVVLESDGKMMTLPKALGLGHITTKDNRSKSNHFLLDCVAPGLLSTFVLNYVLKVSPSNDGAKSGDDQHNYSLEDNASHAALNLPPNLTLNTRSKPANPCEIWSWAGLGLILHTFAVVYPGITTYYFKWNKGETAVARYSYPCFAAGTVSLAIGVMLCGHIIESATQETIYSSLVTVPGERA
ncbi:hypothetical protein CGCA056_v008242 [Colletotrichum aenigma]|uniref:uncharacterized protein n=1 Tax=Colletotrichum aenigma TaxID=1215731 RepID=UPI00187230AA|nr:uncharacterized protein CGCA056_v008242 [Colletotrichum aenigma]KAF5519823.1 hypothetical protein CGCA056_v008242 [Colletotrichum aenigma]